MWYICGIKQYMPWCQAKCAIWPTCGDMQNVLSKTKCVLWPKYGVKQNVFYDQNVVIDKMCCMSKIWYLEKCIVSAKCGILKLDCIRSYSTNFWINILYSDVQCKLLRDTLFIGCKIWILKMHCTRTCNVNLKMYCTRLHSIDLKMYSTRSCGVYLKMHCTQSYSVNLKMHYTRSCSVDLKV